MTTVFPQIRASLKRTWPAGSADADRTHKTSKRLRLANDKKSAWNFEAPGGSGRTQCKAKRYALAFEGDTAFEPAWPVETFVVDEDAGVVPFVLLEEDASAPAVSGMLDRSSAEPSHLSLIHI